MPTKYLITNQTLTTMNIDYSKLNKKEVIELLINQIEQNDALRDGKKTLQYAVEALENRVEVIRELAAEKQTIANGFQARLNDEIEMHAQANDEIERLNEVNRVLTDKKLKAQKKCKEFKAELKHISNLKEQGKLVDIVPPQGMYIGAITEIEQGLHVLNSRLDKQLKEAKKQVNETMKSNIKLSKENGDLNERLLVSINRSSRFEKSTERLEEQNEMLNKNVEILTNNNAELQQKVVKANTAVIDLKHDIANLKRQIK